MTINKIVWRLKEKIIEIFFQKVRVFFYSFLSNIKIKAKKNQPVLANGKGIIKIGTNVNFGVNYSPDYYSKYTYLNARRDNSYIEIGDNCHINNNATIISDGKRIIIGNNCLIGTNLQILDSDFHDLDPANRFGGKNIIKKDVIIKNNVFIGSNVTILKGVVIGENSVIGSNSLVCKSIPDNVIAAGNPVKVVKKL
jgi:acetyltransferase-like isoleucine patch superfamily enzyme